MTLVSIIYNNHNICNGVILLIHNYDADDDDDDDGT